jgi:hypothetical protein
MRISSRRILHTALLLSGATLGLQVHSFVVAGCNVPNPSTAACYTIDTKFQMPNTDCSSLNKGSICYVYITYNINNFPDGADPSPSGQTMQSQAQCWQSTACISDPNKPGFCTTGTFNGWNNAAKTVNNPNVTCPPA